VTCPAQPPSLRQTGRLWPPVAIGGPVLVDWLATLLWGDPVDLGRWRVPPGWTLVLLFVGWNGWSSDRPGRITTLSRRRGLTPIAGSASTRTWGTAI
jgi:hypothetical protein